jgi:hypothetical protein
MSCQLTICSTDSEVVDCGRKLEVLEAVKGAGNFGDSDSERSSTTHLFNDVQRTTLPLVYVAALIPMQEAVKLFGMSPQQLLGIALETSKTKLVN